MSGIGLSFGMVTTGSAFGAGGGAAASGMSDSKPASSSAVDDFLAYMKKSLAERMADAWLAAHGLDREKLKAMKPDERDAVLKQMAKELKDQIAQAADDQAKRNKAAAA
jgi:uncharacterized membrane protein